MCERLAIYGSVADRGACGADDDSDETMVSFTEKTTENAHISFNYTGKVV